MATSRLRLDNTDLFRSLRVGADEGFEPSDTDFINPNFGDATVEGSALLSTTLENTEPEIPLHIKVRDSVDDTEIINDLPNPRFAVNATDWSLTVPSGGGTAVRSTAWAAVGGGFDTRAASILVTDSAAALNADNYIINTASKAIKQSETLSAVAIVKAITQLAGDTIRIVVNWYDATDTLQGSTTGTTTTLPVTANGVYRLELNNVQPPVGATEITGYRILVIEKAAGGAGAKSFAVGAVMAARNVPGTKLLYHDGDSPGWAWDGTPHGSASRGPAIPYANYLANPAPSIDTIGLKGASVTGWGTDNLTYDGDVVDDNTSPTGTALRLGPDPSTNPYIVNDRGVSGAILNLHTLPGDWVCFSAWMKANAAANTAAGANTGLATIGIAGAVGAGGVPSLPSRTTTTWQRIYVSIQMNANETGIYAFMRSVGNSNAGCEVRFAGMVWARGTTQAEAEKIAKNLGGDSFFDGDSLDAEWTPRIQSRLSGFSYRYTGKNGLHKCQQKLDKLCRSAALYEWRDDGATKSTFRDVLAARFEHAYNFRRAQKNWISGSLKLWTKPIAHTGTFVAGTIYQASYQPFVQAPIPRIGGDIPADLQTLIQVGSSPVTHGRIVGMFSAPSGRPCMFPPASMVPGPSSALIGASGAWGSQAIVWSSPSTISDQEIARIYVGASAAPGRSRLLGFGMQGSRREQIYAYDSFGNRLAPQGVIASHMQGYGMIDLGVVNFAPDPTAATQFISLRVSPISAGYNGAHGTPVATAYLSGLILAPDDSLQMVIDTDRKLLAWDDFRNGLNTVDRLGNKYTQLALARPFAASSADGITNGSTGYAGYIVETPTAVTFEMAISFRALLVSNGLKVVANKNRSVATPLAQDFAQFSIGSSLGALALYAESVLVASVAVPSISNLGSTFAGELIYRSTKDGFQAEVRSTYGVRAVNEPDPTLATLGINSAAGLAPGQPLFSLDSPTITTAQVITGFRVTELPSMSHGPRDYYKFTASGVQRFNVSSAMQKRLSPVGQPKSIATAGDAVQVYAFEQSLHDAPLQNVMSVQVSVRERFTYAQ